ncbi:MAG: hypothetical protein H8E66_19440 [Planctomycetes bacterium]|nr:hypothetical protein [Planctomycetota bacterium]
MRSLILSLSAISLLLLTACNVRSTTSEAETAPATPTPIPDSTPPVIEQEVIGNLEPQIVESRPQPELPQDPAPAPPVEFSSEGPSEPVANSSSAEDTLRSVARVLRGAVEGETDEADANSGGSVFGPIGRALSKGFQEAATAENDTEE